MIVKSSVAHQIIRILLIESITGEKNQRCTHMYEVAKEEEFYRQEILWLHLFAA